MAEATLKDVIEEIRAQGDFTRMGSHGSLSVAITELRGVKSAVQTLSENFQLAFNDLIESQRKTIEEGAETADQQRARDALTPKEDKDDKKDSKINMKGLLDSIKGLIPKKSPGMFALLFGGLAGALAFFPDWVKENIIKPIADVFNVASGEEAKTRLGKVLETIKSVYDWIKETFGKDTADLTAIAAGLALLMPLRTFMIGMAALNLTKASFNFLGDILDFVRGLAGYGPRAKAKIAAEAVGIGADAAAAGADVASDGKDGKKRGLFRRIGDSIKDMFTKTKEALATGAEKGKNAIARLGAAMVAFGPGLLVMGAVAASLYAAKEALDYLREINIESTVEDLKKKQANLQKALASGDQKTIDETSSILSQELKRLQNTTLDKVGAVKEEIQKSLDLLAEAGRRKIEAGLKKLQEAGGKLKKEDGSYDKDLVQLITQGLNREIQALSVGKTDKEQITALEGYIADKLEEVKATGADETAIKTFLGQLFDTIERSGMKRDVRGYFAERGFGRGEEFNIREGYLEELQRKATARFSNDDEMYNLKNLDFNVKPPAPTPDLSGQSRTGSGTNVNNVTDAKTVNNNDNRSTVVNNDNSTYHYYNRDLAPSGFFT